MSVTSNGFCLVLLATLVLTGCGPDPWVEQDLGTEADFRDMFFLDAGRGWIVGGRHTIDGGIIGSTVDGGQTWSFRSDPVRNKRGSKITLNAVRFLDERTGIIVDSAGRILRTVDGGDNWHVVLESGGPSARLHDLHFIDEQVGWAVGGGRLFRTDDAGASWTPPLEDTSKRSGFYGRAVHFFDDKRGCLVGQSGAIRITTDGGKTWDRVGAQPTAGAADLVAVHFVDTEYGWTVGEAGTILHSQDAGESWSPQDSSTQAYLTGVQFVSRWQGWAVGYEHDRPGTSTLLETTDGGATWKAETKVEGEELHALFFVDPWTGWAIGDRVRPGRQTLLRYEGER